MKVFLGQGHSGVETYDRKGPGHVEDRLDHSFPDRWIKEVKLSRIVPRHAGTVVTVVDAAFLSAAALYTLENDCGVIAAVVVIFEDDSDPGIRG